jgi:hypothetical protein
MEILINMNKQLSEELHKIKRMMTSIINEDFEMSNINSAITDCESTILDSNTMEIVVIFDNEDKYETYLVSVDFEYEDNEDQTYDYPGSPGGSTGNIVEFKMTYPEEKTLSQKEYIELLSTKEVSRCVYSTIEDMEKSSYDDYKDSGPNPDDYYDRMRDND